MVSANTTCPTPRIRIGLLSEHGAPSVVARPAANNRPEAGALAAGRDGWEDRSPQSASGHQGANDANPAHNDLHGTGADRVRGQLAVVPLGTGAHAHRCGEFHYGAIAFGRARARVPGVVACRRAYGRRQLAVGAGAVRLRRRLFVFLPAPDLGGGCAAAVRRGVW